jgi:hypothetical protein
MTCPESNCFLCKMDSEYSSFEPYRPRPQYRDTIKTKLMYINIAIAVVFILFMIVTLRRK